MDYLTILDDLLNKYKSMRDDEFCLCGSEADGRSRWEADGVKSLHST